MKNMARNRQKKEQITHKKGKKKTHATWIGCREWRRSIEQRQNKLDKTGMSERLLKRKEQTKYMCHIGKKVRNNDSV